jgi:hypothetical protein
MAGSEISRVILHWDAVTGALGYNVMRSSIDGGPYTIVATNLNSTVFTNDSLLSDTTYYYVITALNANGESKSSIQVSVSTPILQPVFGTMSPAGGNMIFSGTNGTPGKSYLVLVSTDLRLPLTNWEILATNTFDSNGAFRFTNTFSPSGPSRFYILQLK